MTDFNYTIETLYDSGLYGSREDRFYGQQVIRRAQVRRRDGGTSSHVLRHIIEVGERPDRSSFDTDLWMGKWVLLLQEPPLSVRWMPGWPEWAREPTSSLAPFIEDRLNEMSESALRVIV